LAGGGRGAAVALGAVAVQAVAQGRAGLAVAAAVERAGLAVAVVGTGRLAVGGPLVAIAVALGAVTAVGTRPRHRRLGLVDLRGDLGTDRGGGPGVLGDRRGGLGHRGLAGAGRVRLTAGASLVGHGGQVS